MRMTSLVRHRGFPGFVHLTRAARLHGHGKSRWTRELDQRDVRLTSRPPRPGADRPERRGTAWQVPPYRCAAARGESDEPRTVSVDRVHEAGNHTRMTGFAHR